MNGDDHAATLLAECNLARVSCEVNEGESSEAMFNALHQHAKGVLAEDDVLLDRIRAEFAVCIANMGHYELAEELLLESHRVRQAIFGMGSDRCQEVIITLVDLYTAWGKPEKAAEYQAMLDAAEAATAPPEEQKAPAGQPQTEGAEPQSPAASAP